jgi:hypothetical protein
MVAPDSGGPIFGNGAPPRNAATPQAAVGRRLRVLPARCPRNVCAAPAVRVLQQLLARTYGRAGSALATLRLNSFF